MLKRGDFALNRHRFCSSTIFSDLPSPAEAMAGMTKGPGLRAGGKPVSIPRIKSGAGFFEILL
jgi:hypothetical protein